MTISLNIPGPVAQDKDWARSARTAHLVPGLEYGEDVYIDFGNVDIATQSFIHALLSEATRIYGEEGLSRIEFHGCSDQVKQTIQTVVTYSLRARDFASELIASDSIRSADIPQADDLHKIRAVVEELSDGPAPVDVIAAELGYSIRHTYYRASSARILDLLQLGSGIAVITPRGLDLINTSRQSSGERKLLKEAILASTVLRKIAPGLLSRRVPKKRDLAQQIVSFAGLSESTALRRAQCLLSWRRQLLDMQLELPVVPDPQKRIG